MQSTTPNALSRYRPAILVVAGVAAAYAGYHIYNTAQTAASSGLHRSNAVRRSGARQRRQVGQATEAARVFGILNGDEPLHLGELPYEGGTITLDLELVASHENVQHTFARLRPPHDQHVSDDDIINLYVTFIQSLHNAIAPIDPASPAQAELVRRWISERYPNNPHLVATSERFVAQRWPASMDEPVESVAGTDISGGSDDGTDADEGDVDGQTLQRTLYHIAEDRARQEGVVHRGITCNGCDEKPIRGIRWHCANCADFDLCSNCEATNSHIKTHIFYKIRVPAPYLSINKQDILYPGKPHMMPLSVNSALKRRLVTETKMEAEEIEALWDQFTCLAGTEWHSDPNHIHWALDRKAFNHAFIPRYNSFVAAPNLIYDRIFAYYDTDKNGLIGFEEWIKGLDGMHASTGHRKAKIVFDGYDVDQDGYISRKDVLRILRAYYAIEKEATRNFVAEITEELSVRRAMDTINSSQPLGSAFPPHDLSRLYADHSRLWFKNPSELDSATPVIVDDTNDVAPREDIVRDIEVRNFPSTIRSLAQQDRIHVDRWAHRQFYVDEEEGQEPPRGMRNGDAVPGVSGASTTRTRSSSTSTSSVSSLVIPDDMGGYKIPEPEKDLGQEVMYQITQQGFNELIDPLFLDKETNAVDAHATQNERRKNSQFITKLTKDFNKIDKHGSRAVCKVGFFRFAKAVADLFFQELNKECDGRGIEQFFLDSEGSPMQYVDAKKKLFPRYRATEQAILRTIDVPEEWSIDDMSCFNISLCRFELREELVTGILQCAYTMHWIAPLSGCTTPADIEAESPKAPTPAPNHERDPTMPQFRPNSLADIPRSPGSRSRSSSTSSILTIDSIISGVGNTIYDPRADEDHRVVFHENGPFFALEKHDYLEDQSSPNEEAGADDTEPAPQQTQSTTPPPPPSAPQTVTPPSRPPPPPTTSDSTHPTPEPWSNIHPTKRISTITNSPVLHLIHVAPGPNKTTSQLALATKPISYAPNPFYPEQDPQILLVRYLRAIASSPQSRLYMLWLASLEVMQREVDERKGLGLVSLDEFERFIELGTCRFLEAWMEWVSI